MIYYFSLLKKIVKFLTMLPDVQWFSVLKKIVKYLTMDLRL